MRLIKRKKGKKDYYYLQHSFRRKNKVITREKYIGTKIPGNLNHLKETFLSELQGSLIKGLEKIKENFQNEWKKIPPTVKEKELQEIAIAFTYNTNAIEGSTITLEETREIIEEKISPNKPLRDVKETEAHNKIFMEMLKKEKKITQKLILKWHEGMFKETKEDIAGKFRDYLVRVGDYIAIDWQDIKKEMNKLVRLINSSKENPLILSGRAHYRFEKIHPFGDGNGRIGRLLMNYILWHKGYPMIIIEYKGRKSYYKALRKNEENFINYFIKRYLSVHKGRLK